MAVHNRYFVAWKIGPRTADEKVSIVSSVKDANCLKKK